MGGKSRKRHGRSGERPLRGVMRLGRIADLQLLLPLAGIVLFLLFPAQAAEGALSGLRLAAEVLIPSLFPVGVLSGCLLRMGPEAAAERLAGRAVRGLFCLPGAGALPLVLGLLGGFPLGARLVASLYREGRLSRAEALGLSALCNNAGPAFLLGVAGSALGDPRLGAALMVVQALSVLLVGLLLRAPGLVPKTAPRRSADTPGFGDALLRSIGDTAGAMLTLTGTVVFFCAALACLEAALPLDRLPPLVRAAVSGALEVSGGVAALRGLAPESAFPLAALLTGWGGCCVHLQAAEALRAAGLPVGPYLRGKLLQGAICLLLAALATVAAETFASPTSVFGVMRFLIQNGFAV